SKEPEVRQAAFGDETLPLRATLHHGERRAAGEERRVDCQALRSRRCDRDRPLVARRRRRGRLREQGGEHRKRQYGHAVLSDRASTNVGSASDRSASAIARPTNDPTRYRPSSDRRSYRKPLNVVTAMSMTAATRAEWLFFQMPTPSSSIPNASQPIV